jgi:hypothetical protein
MSIFNSSESNECIIEIIPGIVLETPEILTNSSTLNSTSVIIEWTEIQDADDYYVYINNTFNISTIFNNYSFEFPAKNITYRFRIIAHTENITSEPSNECIIDIFIEYTIEPDPDSDPIFPPHPTVIITPSSEIRIPTFTIEWTEIENASGYHVLLNGTFYSTVNGTFKEFNFSTYETTYNFSVIVYNESGNSSISNYCVISISELQTVIIIDRPIIYNLSSSVNTTDFFIKWSLVESAEGYHIFLNNTFLATVSANSFNFSMMENNTIYYIQIMAYSGNIYSLKSEVLIITIEIESESENEVEVLKSTPKVGGLIGIIAGTTMFFAGFFITAYSYYPKLKSLFIKRKYSWNNLFSELNSNQP